jgi:voltage-gated potassium channel
VTGLTRLLIAIVFSQAVMVAGVVGYMLIEKWSFLDSVYMTLITLTTVGFGEVHQLSRGGQIFTIILIIFGVGTVFYIFASINTYIFEGHVRALLEKRKLEKRIQGTKGHLILCGFGRIGSQVAQMLDDQKVPLVVVDNNPQHAELLDKAEFAYVIGEATEEETLLKAGLKRAEGLITCLPSTAANLYVTMTARELKPDLFILARAEDERDEVRLRKAGADHVVQPNRLGARRMAMAVIRPTVTDFIDQTFHDPSFNLQMEELPVQPGATLKDVTLQESGIRQKLDLIVVAIKKPDGQMFYNPSPKALIEVGDTLIALGPRGNLPRLGALLGNTAETPAARFRL